MLARSALLFIFLSVAVILSAQIPADTALSQLKSPEKYLVVVSSKAENLQEKLDKKSKKALTQMRKDEEKLLKKLSKIDSLAAMNIFGNADEQYKQLQEKLKKTSALSHYIPKLDSLSTSLDFLGQHSQFLSQAKDAKEKLQDAIEKTKALKEQLQKAEDIKKFLKERKQYLKEQLEKFGLAKDLKKINKQVYYYQQQVNEYVAILKDPKKVEKKVLELLSRTKLFQDFFRKNSMLASLFRMPGDPNDPAYLQSLSGLQTRAQVNNLIQQQIQSAGANGMQQYRQSLQSAQSQLNELKSKVLKAGSGSSDDIMPEGFRPNSQKTKGLLKRLELGTNLQTQRATSFFPVTTDLGMSIGYEINDKSVIGIGGSYKLGLGRGWDRIRLTSEGAGIRSFVDIKLKGSFWLSGGFEANYRSAFSDFIQLQDKTKWQQSGLIGLSKTISVKSKFFKKTKAQVFWDFLSQQQVPRTQAVVFRMGYNF